MDRLLQAQLTPFVSIDGYRRKQSFNQSKFHHASVKRGRIRGVFLSHQGWQKLTQARVLHAESGKRHSYEYLSERSHLDERTVSRLLSGEVRVDKNTLRTFFRAFNLSLEADDYTTCRSERTNDISSVPSTYDMVAIQRAEFEQIVEELTQLKQRLREYDRLFHRLGLNEGHGSFNLTLPL